MMKRFSRFFWASLLLLLILIVTLAAWAYHHARETAYNLLREEGEALADAIEYSALHGFRTESILREQLLEIFREEVLKLDQELVQAEKTHQREPILRRAVERHRWDLAVLLDDNLQLKSAYPARPGLLGQEGSPLSPDMETEHGGRGPMGMRGSMGRAMGTGPMGRGSRLRAFVDSPERTIVLQGMGWQRMGGMEPFVVAHKRQNGELLVVRASLDRLQETFNPASVETLFRNLSLGKTMVSVALADEDGIVRLDSEESWIGKPLRELESALKQEKDDVLTVIRPLRSAEDLPKGQLMLVLSTAAAKSNLAETRRGILLMGLATLLVGFAGLVVISLVQKRAMIRVESLQQTVARSQRLASLGQMAGQVAHEIKNPLNAITLTLEGLRRQLKKLVDKPEVYDNYFDLTQQELSRLNRIVEDFLQFSRFPPLNRREMNLNTWLSEIATLYQSQAQEKQLTIACEMPEVPLVLQADSDQLRQALGNLLLNAIQSSPPGETIQLRLQKQRHGVSIEVQDRGQGIPEKDLERVLEPYYTTRRDGSGLGLPIAQRIIEDHGGTLQLRSQSGKGTHAVLSLPER
jgi:signal transduction histidine kinase